MVSRIASAGAFLMIALMLASCGESRPKLPSELRSEHVLSFQQLSEGDVAAIRSVNAGQDLDLPLPGGAIARMTVDRRMSVMPGVVSLSGGAIRIPAPEEQGGSTQGTWALSYEPDGMAGTVTFGSVIFEVVTARTAGGSWVLQVDSSKYDILPGSAPLETPREGPQSIN
jgi:hypothetical protein